MAELKPCPFCGGTKIKNLKGSSPYPAARHGICFKCEKCGSRSGIYLKEENAIKAWNRRSGMPTLEEFKKWVEDNFECDPSLKTIHEFFKERMGM